MKKCTSDSVRSETVLIATAPVQTPEPREVDISNLSPEDLQSLKEQDPFLYYSIPGVRRASLRLEDIDTSKLLEDDQPQPRRSSCPARVESRPSTTVKRCTRVSFECHTDVLLEDMLGKLEEKFSQQDLQKIDLHFAKMMGLESLSELY